MVINVKVLSLSLLLNKKNTSQTLRCVYVYNILGEG